MILIVQNVACEGPGTIVSYLSSHAAPSRVLRAFAGERFPSSLVDLSHIVILGGPMSVYEEQEFPFLKGECRLLEAAIQADIPTLGICLGAQLVAKVLGVKVKKAAQKEVGWYNVRLTREGKKDRLFRGLGEELRVFQWHEDTFDLPEGAVLLCRGEACPNQVFRYGKNIYGAQFHVEVDGGMVEDWFGEYPADSELRKKSLAEYDEVSATFHEQARRLYANFFR
jgi:GMP synthase (glutamine-hydrolysing)